MRAVPDGPTGALCKGPDKTRASWLLLYSWCRIRGFGLQGFAGFLKPKQSSPKCPRDVVKELVVRSTTVIASWV